MARRSRASRLDRGSSNRSTDGRITIARATATRCCWPPDSWRGIPRHPVPRAGRASSASSTRSVRSARRHPAHPQAVRDVLGDGQVREERIALEDHADVAAIRGRRLSSTGPGSRPRRRRAARSRPRSGGSSSCRTPRARGEPRTRPAPRSRSTPSTATVRPKVFRRPRRTRWGVPGGVTTISALLDLPVPALHPLLAPLAELIPVGRDQPLEVLPVGHERRHVRRKLDGAVGRADEHRLGVERLRRRRERVR